MEKERKGFWRNFTWKRFLVNILLFFSISFSFELLFNTNDSSQSFGIKLLKSFTSSILSAFTVTVMLDMFQQKKK